MDNIVLNIAIVIPAYNEEETINFTIETLKEYIESLSEKYTLVFVDDGSSDKTWSIIKKYIVKGYPIEGLSLSRNFGHQAALYAGMEFCYSKYDAIISIDCDLQQDIKAIPRLVESFKSGNEIVYAARNHRESDSFLKRITAKLFYKLMSILDVALIKDHADYRLISNKALAALLEYKEVDIFLRGLLPTLGFKSEIIKFEVSEREYGISKYTWKKMVNLANNGILSFTAAPLYLIFILGLFITLLSVTYVVYGFVSKIFLDAVPGWSSLIVSIYFLGGVQMLSIGIIGLYVNKIYYQSKNRPRYIVQSFLTND